MHPRSSLEIFKLQEHSPGRRSVSCPDLPKLTPTCQTDVDVRHLTPPRSPRPFFNPSATDPRAFLQQHRDGREKEPLRAFAFFLLKPLAHRPLFQTANPLLLLDMVYLLPRLLYHTSNFEIQRRSVCRSVVRVDYLVLGQQSIRAVWRGLPERRKATIGGKTFCVTHVKGSAGAQHTHCFVLGWSGLAISCPCCVRRLLPWFLHTSA